MMRDRKGLLQARIPMTSRWWSSSCSSCSAAAALSACTIASDESDSSKGVVETRSRKRLTARFSPCSCERLASSLASTEPAGAGGAAAARPKGSHSEIPRAEDSIRHAGCPPSPRRARPPRGLLSAEAGVHVK
jgi:hypothetical protein